MHTLTFLSWLADSLFNSNTPSRVSECFFKQISFHAKFTSVAVLGYSDHFLAHNRRQKCLCSLTTF
jgi:hypothetical protein